MEIIQRHPPERGQRKAEVIVLYACCCSCCCCLHTIGGFAGALIAGARGNFRAEPTLDESPETRYPSSHGLYWLSFLISLALVTGLSVTFIILFPSNNQFSSGPLEALMVIGFFLIIFGPAWLLAASLVMGLWLGLSNKLRSRSEYWSALGWITVGNVLGSVLGLIVMFFPLLFFGLFR